MRAAVVLERYDRRVRAAMALARADLYVRENGVTRPLTTGEVLMLAGDIVDAIDETEPT